MHGAMHHEIWVPGPTYSLASRAARLLSSSLYLVAALDWYFVLGSLLFSAAVPPFCWKNLVAESLPPTFITRSWSHCHSGHVSSRTYRGATGGLGAGASRGVGGAALTIEVRRADKRDVDAEVAVVRRAVEAEVDAKGNRGPRRVLLVAVEARLAG